MISEQQLLEQARNLDQRALAEIYDCYSPRLYRYAFRLLGDACLAEDCVAETFSRFLRELHEKRGPREHLQAYLFRMAHNFVVDFYRKTPADELKDDLPDKTTSVEKDAGNRVQQQHIRSAIQQLSSVQQQVLSLKFWEDWDNDEIARVLRKPVGAVKSLQHRALVHLQKLLLDEKGESI